MSGRVDTAALRAMLDEMARAQAALDASRLDADGIEDLFKAQGESYHVFRDAIMTAAPALLDEIDALRKVAKAAEPFVESRPSRLMPINADRLRGALSKVPS